MSRLTSNTREVYVAVVYNAQDQRIKEGSEYVLRTSAVTDAHDLVKYYVEACDEYYYARIEHRIVPTYE